MATKGSVESGQITRHPRRVDMSPITIRLVRRSVSVRGPTSPMGLVYGILLLAAVGTILLLLPISSTSPGITPFRDALFTAVSASTVTGLVVVDSAIAWTGFGKAVILVLLFVSGLGFTTGAAFLILLTSERLGLRNRLTIREGLGSHVLGGLAPRVRRVVLVSVGLQTIGTLVMFLDFYVFVPLWEGIGAWEALWHALFNSISAFNNAGFEILPNDKVGGAGLTGLRTAYFLLITMMVLIVAGSISFSVLSDVWNKKRWPFLTLDTKMVLIGTGVLIIIGWVGFLVINWNNPGTTGTASIGEKLVSALFESITTRSSGFSTIDLAQASDTHSVLAATLMFIGGASASVAGGIKVNTFMIIMLALFAALRGYRSVQVMRRSIPLPNVARAMVVGAMAVIVVVVSMFVLPLVQPELEFRAAAFEVVSAFATAGLSHGITGQLNTPASVLIIVLMLVGRLGPLTLALLMVGSESVQSYQFAKERIRIG